MNLKELINQHKVYIDNTKDEIRALELGIDNCRSVIKMEECKIRARLEIRSMTLRLLSEKEIELDKLIGVDNDL